MSNKFTSPLKNAPLSALATLAFCFGDQNAMSEKVPLAPTAPRSALSAPRIIPASLPPPPAVRNDQVPVLVRDVYALNLVTPEWDLTLQRVLPRIDGTTAAVAQLTVPVIAMLGGVLLLGETLGLPLIGASLVVLGGVALSVVPLRGRR